MAASAVSWWGCCRLCKWDCWGYLLCGHPWRCRLFVVTVVIIGGVTGTLGGGYLTGADSAGNGLSWCRLAVLLNMCCRQDRSCRFLAPRCCALALCLMTCTRFAAAAMSASVGDTAGFVRSLCLKNTVAEMRVVHVETDQNFQHR